MSHSPEETRQIAKTLSSSLRRGDVLLLDGSLGSGKTTFAQGIAEGLGVLEPLRSPTYLYLLEYEGRFPLYHLDLYRVEEEEFLDELGLRELLEGNGIVMVEWWKKFPSYFPQGSMQISLKISPDGTRTITVEGP